MLATYNTNLHHQLYKLTEAEGEKQKLIELVFNHLLYQKTDELKNLLNKIL